MRRDTITVQGFLLECFLYEGYVHTWECSHFHTENVIGGGGGGEEGGEGGWNKNALGGNISKN